MSDGFLSRWSRRKLEGKEGTDVVEPTVDRAVLPPPQPSPEGGGSSAAGSGGAQAEPPPPTLEDARSLTPQSDFKRFAAADVAPEVKNAAMKKLFADPRYNVMDGLDIYTGDYSRPDPVPDSMLRQLASAKFLGLFDTEEKEEEAARAAAEARDVADNPTAQSVAQSDAALPAVPGTPDHADADLRLQQDHAAAGKDPGRGTG